MTVGLRRATLTYELLHVTSRPSRQMNRWTQFPITRRNDEMRAEG